MIKIKIKLKKDGSVEGKRVVKSEDPREWFVLAEYVINEIMENIERVDGKAMTRKEVYKILDSLHDCVAERE